MRLPVILLVLLIPFVSVAQSTIVINEFLSNNTTGITDQSGEYHDWIELYNCGEKKFDLEGYGLSNDPSDPYKYRFPETKIKSKSHLLLFASEKETNVKGEIHINFKLCRDGAPLILTDPKGRRVDQVHPIALVKNCSYGRTQDGHSNFERFFKPTPKTSNNKAAGIVFSAQQGFYTESFVLELESKIGEEIRYTIDGSTPNINSPLYAEPIKIETTESDSSAIGYINTSPIEKTIKGNYFKGTVIRAATFNDGAITSVVYTKSYFISPLGRRRYANIDVVSLVTDNGNLFHGDTGIYVEGDSVKYASRKANYYNRGKAWERNAHVTFFDTLGLVGFEQNIGIRIHGGKGRQNPQKSIRLCADEEYGAAAINYPLFKMREHTVFKTVVLRNSMSCWERSIVKDECTAELCQNLNFDVLAARPAIVFINGEFWGIHAIREYFDADFIAINHGVEKKDVNIVTNGYGNNKAAGEAWGLLEGNGDTHKELYQFLRTHSLAETENYSYINKYLNLESIIDYYCVELFFNNRDWPANNNKLWSVGDGPWSQVLFDMDAGWSRSFEDNIEIVLKLKKYNRPQHKPFARLLFRKLVESPLFVEDFTHRMAYLINHDLSHKKVAPILARAKVTYEDYILENDRRWGVPTSLKKWKALFFTLNGFAEGRPNHLEKVFLNNFNVSLDSLRRLNY
jgi:hypothetical protein